jgi:L-lactate dehydrogenase
MTHHSENATRKVVITGAGAVGMAFAYALMGKGLAEEIVLIDTNQARLAGEVMDLSHGSAFAPMQNIRIGDASDYGDAALIVLTAGAAQKPGETRLNLLERNAQIIRAIMGDIRAAGGKAPVVIVSNPVDLLTQIAIAELEDGRQRVFGSGTVLDSARFRHILSRKCQVDIHDVHAYILGEHGDSEIAAWSLSRVGGTPVTALCSGCGCCDLPLATAAGRDAVQEQVRNSAYHIIDAKGATSYGVGMALVEISAAVLRDQHSVLTVSTLLQGEYGQQDICLSVPCVVGRKGVLRVIPGTLSPDEQCGLDASAGVLRERLLLLEKLERRPQQGQ